MTPAKLKRKTKNRMLSYAKAMCLTLREDGFNTLDHIHDLAMRCYAEGYTHGEAAERESHSIIKEG